MRVAPGSTGRPPVRQPPPRRPARGAPIVLTAAHPPARRPVSVQQALQRAKTASAASRARPKPKPAAPPYVNPFPAGVRGGRTDQGVDYTGRAGSPIYAPGAGKITIATQQSGWPGGGFVAERLSQGPAKGQIVYFAEDVQPSGVGVGSTVKAGQPIAKFNQGGWIEAGWGATQGGDAAAAQQAGQSSGYVPVGAGAYSTGFGVAFGKWIAKLRGPGPGSIYSNIVGGAPPWASNPGGAGTAAPAARRAAATPAPRPSGASRPAPPSYAPRVTPSRPPAGPTRPPILGPRRAASTRPARARARGGGSVADQRPPLRIGPFTIPSPAPVISPVPTLSTPTSSTATTSGGGGGGISSVFQGSAGSAGIPGAGAGGAGSSPAAPVSAATSWEPLIVLGLVALVGFLLLRRVGRGRK